MPKYFFIHHDRLIDDPEDGVSVAKELELERTSSKTWAYRCAAEGVWPFFSRCFLIRQAALLNRGATFYSRIAKKQFLRLHDRFERAYRIDLPMPSIAVNASLMFLHGIERDIDLADQSTGIKSQAGFTL